MILYLQDRGLTSPEGIRITPGKLGVIFDARQILDLRVARDQSIGRITEYAVTIGAGRLVLERDDSRATSDRRVIQKVLGKDYCGLLSYDHMRATEEPLLWVADAIAWSFASTNVFWRRRVEPLITEVIPVADLPVPRRA